MRVILSLYIIMLASVSGAQTDEGDPGEFRREMNRLNERYEDFFVREAETKRYYDSLRQSIPELKVKRQTETVEAETALKIYRSERRAKPDTTELEKAWDAEQAAGRAVHDRHRQLFVNQRDQLKKISETVRQIPENRDAGLE